MLHDRDDLLTNLLLDVRNGRLERLRRRFQLLVSSALFGLPRCDARLESGVGLLAVQGVDRVLDRLAFRRELRLQRLGSRTKSGLLGLELRIGCLTRGAIRHEPIRIHDEDVGLLGVRHSREANGKSGGSGKQNLMH